MFYEKRNLENINKLAPNTKEKALAWHKYCQLHKINILIYETTRTEAQQRQYVEQGASQTMKSYHLVGQALDFVPVDSKGNCLWGGYDSLLIKQAINYAKVLGFEWGGDWKTFIDKPHLQYNYQGYGTDREGAKPVSHNQMVYLVNLLYTGNEGQKKWAKKELQKELNK
jgi:peptidoglycan LD-endopeptidase CwlK